MLAKAPYHKEPPEFHRLTLVSCVLFRATAGLHYVSTNIAHFHPPANSTELNQTCFNSKSMRSPWTIIPFLLTSVRVCQY